MQRCFLLIFFLALGFSAQAQYAETIRSGRPGQSIDPYAVGAGGIQIQTGNSYTNLSNFFPGPHGRHDWETVLRAGIFNRFELNALLNYNRLLLPGGPSYLNGLNAFHLGLRYHLYTGKGLVPSLGFQYRVKLRAVSRDFRPPGTGSQFTLVSQQYFGEAWAFTVNTGLDWDGIQVQPAWFYVLNLSRSIGKRWGVFIENYGGRSYGEFQSNFDGGLSFLVTPDFQLDLLAGGNRESYFISTGLSWRFRVGSHPD